MNRYATALCAELQPNDQFKLRTMQGTAVANGAGYGPDGPGAAVAAAGQAWVFVSGAVHLWRSAVSTTEAVDVADNRKYTLAEAMYVAAIDGPVAAVLIGA
jgi:hypothetical protein